MCVCLLFVTAHWGVENLHKNVSTMHAMASKYNSNDYSATRFPAVFERNKYNQGYKIIL